MIASHSSLRALYPEQAGSSKPISWWPSPGSGCGQWFDILLRERDERTGALTINGAAGEVGRLQLPDGVGVGVVATEIPSDAAHKAVLEQIRSQARGRPLRAPGCRFVAASPRRAVQRGAGPRAEA